MGAAKIHFSQEEILLVQNADILLTKNRIIERVYELFGRMGSLYQTEMAKADKPLIRDAATTLPKVSRGENYKGLPYVMLDYPRTFTRNDVFSIRTFFWWGNYISLTLHLKGLFQQALVPNLLTLQKQENRSNVFVSTNDNEWDHDLNAGGYRLHTEITEEEWNGKVLNDPFLKLSTKADLHEWNNAETLLTNSFRMFVELTKD